jgi:hypothetical protein
MQSAVKQIRQNLVAPHLLAVRARAPKRRWVTIAQGYHNNLRVQLFGRQLQRSPKAFVYGRTVLRARYNVPIGQFDQFTAHWCALVRQPFLWVGCIITTAGFSTAAPTGLCARVMRRTFMHFLLALRTLGVRWFNLQTTPLLQRANANKPIPTLSHKLCLRPGATFCSERPRLMRSF